MNSGRETAEEVKGETLRADSVLTLCRVAVTDFLFPQLQNGGIVSYSKNRSDDLGEGGRKINRLKQKRLGLEKARRSPIAPASRRGARAAVNEV